MYHPANASYIIIGEINVVLTAMRRSNTCSLPNQQEEVIKLMKNLIKLKESVAEQINYSSLDPVNITSPFLDIIRFENTTSIITCYCLSSIYKILSYGLIDKDHASAPAVVENIANAVTHARFLGTDTATDEVALMRIIQVLQLLLLSPLGILLTNVSVCEIMQSFFRICFETRLSEILRKMSETALINCTQLLFSSLYRFTEDFEYLKKTKEGSSHFHKHFCTFRQNSSEMTLEDKDSEHIDRNLLMKSDNKKKCCKHKTDQHDVNSLMSDAIKENKYKVQCLNKNENSVHNESNCASSAIESEASLKSKIKIHSMKVSSVDLPANVNENHISDIDSQSIEDEFVVLESSTHDSKGVVLKDYNELNCNCCKSQNSYIELGSTSVSYGLPCVKELLKLLVSLINPQDEANSEVVIHIGLNLIIIALEIGTSEIGKFSSLLKIVQDKLCRNLFSLLTVDHLMEFSFCLRTFYLLFETSRIHLKFQLETFLLKLMEIIFSESPNVSYEQREMSLDCICQLYRIPGFITELYVNYDCGLYCSNIFEDLTKLLSTNAFSIANLFSSHMLSLNALLTVIESIENNGHNRVFRERSIKSDSFSLESSEFEMFNEEIYCSIKSDLALLSEDLPTHEEMMALKRKKKILVSGIEQFNSHPDKGVSFLQKHKLLMTPSNPVEIANFLRFNLGLDKKMIGEYISNRKNKEILQAYVRTFSFENTRIDDALRQYLETFRLPGEAPLISLILDRFSEHWHKSNNNPFAHNDVAFTLAYAIILLNVDQHNNNVKKQKTPMTMEDFKKNLKGINGGENFSNEMVENIFNSIKSEEIVVPTEQTGVIRDNYIWKVLLQRGSTKEGIFKSVLNGPCDHDLFTVAWGPTVAALSFILDKSNDVNVFAKIINGYYRCAAVASYYKMCEVFDSIIISLCKFTSLTNVTEHPKTFAIVYGNNKKAQMVTKALFHLANLHKDLLREGWKNILCCLINLFKMRLLPEEKVLLKGDDFVHPNGVISLICESNSSNPKAEFGLLSTFYSYITDSPGEHFLVQEDESAKQLALECIKECHCEQLVTDSELMEMDSFMELLKSLLLLCQYPEPNVVLFNSSFEADISVFTLEMLVKLVVINSDRLANIWSCIQIHLFRLVINSAITEHCYLFERAVVGLLRIVVQLIHKKHMVKQVLQSLQALLILKPSSLLLVSREVSYALYELITGDITTVLNHEFYALIFFLLERVGAGAKLPIPSNMTESENEDHESSGAQSDSEIMINHTSSLIDKGYTSDSELYINQVSTSHNFLLHKLITLSITTEIESQNKFIQNLPSMSQLIFEQDLSVHDPLAFLKCCELLIFIVRDSAYVTEENIGSCIHCIRTFAQASLHKEQNVHKKNSNRTKCETRKKTTKKEPDEKRERIKYYYSTSNYTQGGYVDDDNEEQRDFYPAYEQASLQILDLIYILYTKASTIFGPVNMSSKDIWNISWCPLLQGIARYCCDSRKCVRIPALNLLSRAFLAPDLKILSPSEWENCFQKVLFPLLAQLLNDVNCDGDINREETQIRGATLMCKVFLQHLVSLQTLPTFMHLWLTILDFMDEFMQLNKRDLLADAIPELLKNMLLVMETSKVFENTNNISGEKDPMWNITWNRIKTFLPELKNEIFNSKLTSTKSSDILSEVELNSTLVGINHSTNMELINVECKKNPMLEPLQLNGIVVSEESLHPDSPIIVVSHAPVSFFTCSTDVNVTDNCSKLLSTSKDKLPVTFPLIIQSEYSK